MISLGVLTSSVPREDVEAAIAAHGRQAKRRGGTLPPHVMAYYTVAMALFADEDYEGVMRRLAWPLQQWNSWDPSWNLPTSGGITQARKRLGYEAMATVFERIAVPVASALTHGAFVAGRRTATLDGMVFDLRDTPANTTEFGKPSKGVLPQARVVTLNECGSHAPLGAVISGVAGKGTGERAAAGQLLARLEQDMLLICDQGFYSFGLWCTAADTGADLLWRLGDIMALPVLQRCGDGSYITLLFAPSTAAAVRGELIERARAGQDLAGEETRVRWARVIEYEVGDRGCGELICLLTTILDPADAPAAILAAAYHDRWQHETANAEVKTGLRGPGKVLRSESPDMVRAEIYGYLIAHYALSTLICRAAEETGIDPHRVKFTNTVRIVRDHIADPDAFSP
jgi:hypothetical protein